MERSLAKVFGGLFVVTIIAGMVLVNTKANADTSANASVNVSDACTLSGGDHSYNVTLNPGQEDSNIGPSNIKAVCNDYNGYSIYAIGYSGNSYTGNNTKLLGTIANNNISTNTSGNDSYWAMKVNAVSGTYTPTITNDFDNSNFHIIPANYTQIAKLTSATDAGSNPTGSNISTYYKVKISTTQTADTYTGKVKYTLVHPNNAPEPIYPGQVIACPSGKICYQPNVGSEVKDTMGDQQIPVRRLDYDQWLENCEGAGGHNSDYEFDPNYEYYDENDLPICESNTTYDDIDIEYTYMNTIINTLWVSNFQRDGYGFAGWNTKPDYTGDSYGPNETISLDAEQYSGDNPGLSLYAVWVPSAGDLQNWTGCSAMPQGGVTALTDTRDNQVYTVAKLKDNNCWMTENLRLESQYTTSSADIAKAQGYNSSFIGLADPETANFSSSAANSLYSTDGSTSAPAITGSDLAYRFPRYNNQNTSNPTSNLTAWGSSEDYDQNVYSLGNYYTWPAAIADTSRYNSMNQNVVGISICPSGWRLPSGGSSSNSANSDFWKLGVAIMGFAPANNNSYVISEVNTDGKTSSQAFRSYPNNFVYSGNFSDSWANNRGTSGSYWTSTAGYWYNSYILFFNNSTVMPGTVSYGKFNGYSIRCLTGS